MRVRLIKQCTYHAQSFKFDKTNPEQDVPPELGKILLDSGYFEEVEQKKTVRNKKES